MVTLENVRYGYRSASAGSVLALDGLSLEVEPGEVFGLLGPNGAGKSTTVSLCAGLLAADSGRVEITGNGSYGGNPTTPAVRRTIGIAPQALALYDLLSGEENLRFFGGLYGLAGAQLTARVQWSLEFVGLADRRRDRVNNYSGGMKRRLNLAAALVHDPALILLDEPTAGVDPQSRNQIFDNILELRRLGRTVVYTTHYMEEAERLCDRVAIVDKGRVLAVGPVRQLLETYGVKPTVVLQGTTLEQVFLQLTGRSLRD